MRLVSIIIPCRNESSNIKLTIDSIAQEFEDNEINYEIVVINDGSEDETEFVVRDIIKSNPKVRIVANESVHGIGNAVKKGLEVFKGDIVIIAMADSSDDPKNMIQYVKEIEKGFDCCFGNRWDREVVIENYPKHKLWLNRLANYFIRVLFQLKYGDITNAFKCYSRQTIEGIKPILSHHFNITVELPLKAITRGYSYNVIPTNWYGRKRGKSSLKIKEMGSRYLFIILYIFLEKALAKKDYQKK